jgi:hypothetical protein
MPERFASWRLSAAQRKVVLLLHIVTGIGWMGADIVLFILLYTGLTTNDGAVAASSYTAVRLFVPVAVPVLSIAVLATGLLLGWGSKWGVLRYWWVLIKFVMSTLMVFLVVFSLVPGVNDLGTPDATMSADAVRASLGDAPTQMLFPPIVSFLMLATAAILSVFKPWRRTPWSKQDERIAAGSQRRASGRVTGLPVREDS